MGWGVNNWDKTRRSITVGIALAVLVAAYVQLYQPWQKPLGYSLVADVETQPGRIKVKDITLVPVRQFVEKSNKWNAPAVVIVLPGPSETGTPSMRNVQVFAKGPNIGKIELDDVEVNGNVVIIRREGKFKKVLDDWLSYPGDSFETSIHIYVWYGDTHVGFAAVNYNPKQLAKSNATIYAKPYVHTAEKPKKDGAWSHNSPKAGVYCYNKWRYNYTVFDTAVNLGGKIPILFIYNTSPQSGDAAIIYEITPRHRFYATLGVVLGQEVGPYDIVVKELYTIPYDVKDDSTRINDIYVLGPNKAIWAGVYGRLKVARYDEWEVCHHGSSRFERRTGNVMLQTDIFYLNKDSTGKTLAFSEFVAGATLNMMYSLRKNYAIFTTLAVDPKKRVYLHNYYNDQMRICNDPHIGMVIGAIIAATNSTKPWAIPISIHVDSKETDIEYRNQGAAGYGGVNVAEYVDMYALSVPTNIEGCKVQMPVAYIISR